MTAIRYSFLRDSKTGHPIKGSFFEDKSSYKLDKILEDLHSTHLSVALIQSNQQYNIQSNLSNISNQLISLSSQNMEIKDYLLNERYEKAISKFRECISYTEESFISNGTYLPNSSKILSSLLSKLLLSIDDLLNYFSNDAPNTFNDDITKDIFYKIYKSIDYMLAVIIKKAINKNSYTVKNKKKGQKIIQDEKAIDEQLERFSQKIIQDEKAIDEQLERFSKTIRKKLFVIKNDVAYKTFNYFNNQIINNPSIRYSFFNLYDWVNYKQGKRWNNYNWDKYPNDYLCWDLWYHISFYVHIQELENEKLKSYNSYNWQDFDELISYLIKEYKKKYNFTDLEILSSNDIRSLCPELITRILVTAPYLRQNGLELVLLCVEQIDQFLKNNFTFDKLFEKYRKDKEINLY